MRSSRAWPSGVLLIVVRVLNHRTDINRRAGDLDPFGHLERAVLVARDVQPMRRLFPVWWWWPPPLPLPLCNSAPIDRIAGIG